MLSWLILIACVYWSVWCLNLIPIMLWFFWFIVMHFVCVFGWLKMVVFRWLGYLFKLFMVIMCVISILWILFALCWFEHFILFMPYLIVICSLLVRCVLHWVWGTFGSLQLINACWSICLVMSPRALMFKVLCSLIIEITMCYGLIWVISFIDCFLSWIWS